MAAYGAVLALARSAQVALNTPALILPRQRQWSEAESLALRGIATGRCGDQCYMTAYTSQALQGHGSDAQATLERFARAAPGDPSMLFVQALPASSQFDYAPAQRLTRHAPPHPPPTPS